jgi:hypothetical protein
VRLPRHIALCLPLLLVPCAAHADDISPVQAQALQQQLKDWLAGLFGPGIATPALPLQIAGEGDHYRMTWPIKGLDDPPGGAAVTASARPLDGGRWAIDGIKLPESADFTVTIPDTGDAATSGPLKAAITVGRQDSHAVIDPALASPSTVHIDLGDVAVTTDTAKQHQEQRIGRYAVETSLKPAQDGRLDATVDTTVEGWDTAAQTEGHAALAMGAQRVHALGRVDGISRDKVSALAFAMNALFRALSPDVMEKHGKGDLPQSARAQLRALIEALPDLLTGIKLEETMDGLQLEVAGMGGLALQHTLLGVGGEAPDGNVHAWFDIGLDGLDTPSLPPKMTAYLPHHIELRPSISGIRTTDLSKLALDATEEGAGDDTLGPDIAAIFAHGGVNLAIETLSFDLGPAKVEGVGKLVVLSPDFWHGEARLSATGLDELTAQARQDPELQQALPVLIVLRGLGKPDGNRLVWDIASEGTAVTVNGIDLSAVAGDKPKAKQPNPPPGQPRRR